MNYYLIADLNVQKFNIYHLRGDEDFYYDFLNFMRDQTNHNVVSQLQDEPFRNVSIPNAEEKDEPYFQNYMKMFLKSRY